MMDLAEKNLIIFAGKGGVGKTTTSAAVALWLASQGKRTLVVTVDPAKRLKDALGVDVGFTGTEVAPNLHALMMDPRTVIEDWLKTHAPEHKEEVVGHPLFKYVENNMPGLNELLAIGKLMEMRDAGKYDCIVIDTAPTGHALTFLAAPQNIKDLFEETSLIVIAVKSYQLYSKLKNAGAGLVGFFTGSKAHDIDIDFEKLFKEISAEADRINKVLTDPKITVLNIVTLPEQLPAQETLELRPKVQDLGIKLGYIIVNKVQPDELGSLRDEFLELNADEDTKEELKIVVEKAGYDPRIMKRVVSTVEFSDRRRQMNLYYINWLKQEIKDVPIIEVPLEKKDVTGLDELTVFSRHLFAGARKPA
jgi:TRC40/GET3/ArsA family transport-energizing ATPase